ncbi:hypothetical protein [Mariluticola halotolerans]|uniref:hypothetical protein n=1 Tax=Mariluticola halotolerans TaxID=2909283 RepID=UPI0026E156B0|nr:hypothetical protein [Mariluticola halotolerans]UJQ94745.1 hypothetical protein L1P08_01785 [Mariluticola halotolerans]
MSRFKESRTPPKAGINRSEAERVPAGSRRLSRRTQNDSHTGIKISNGNLDFSTKPAYTKLTTFTVRSNWWLTDHSKAYGIKSVTNLTIYHSDGLTEDHNTRFSSISEQIKFGF